MKTKTIFKGVINGKEFNNVNEYNAVLTELMAKGVAINASTSTSTSTELIDEEPNINMLPGFGVMSSKVMGSNKMAYVDNYVTGNDEADSEKLANLAKYLDKNIERVTRKILDMDYTALKEYEHDVKNVLGIIGQDIANTEDTIKNKTQELKVLINAMKVLKLWDENYKAYFDIIKDAYTSFDKAYEKNDDNCNCECECKCEHCKEEELKADLEKLLNSEKFAEVINNITKLLNGWE